MSITVECGGCGYVRQIDRAAVLDGTWRRQPCPNCTTADEDDEAASAEEEPD